MPLATNQIWLNLMSAQITIFEVIQNAPILNTMLYFYKFRRRRIPLELDLTLCLVFDGFV